MKPSVTIVIPAWNEGEHIAATLQAVRRIPSCSGLDGWDELIVVDDGSTDHTAEAASNWADRIIRHPRKKGKGEALHTGWMEAKGDILLFADADLGDCAIHLGGLLEPVRRGEADMAIARFPAPSLPGGFGIVKRLSAYGIYRLCGYRTAAPLSGQRAVRRELLRKIGPLSSGFGVEVGLTIDAVRSGFKVCEVPLPLRHRETGRDWNGFVHRGKQFVSISRTLIRKWRHP